jgi:hypothetical protein
MRFVRGGGRANALRSLGHDVLSQRGDNREVKCCKRTMNPRREVNVGRAAEIGARRIVWARWEKLWLLENRGMTGAGGETAGRIPNPVMASHNVPCRHAQAGVGTFSIQNRDAARAEPIVRIHGHPKTGLQLDDKFGRIKGEPKHLGGNCGLEAACAQAPRNNA